MRTVLHSSPLLFCLGSVYLTDRYTFFDLFIKRGLSLLVAILLLTLYFSLILPVLGGFDFALGRALGICSRSPAGRGRTTVVVPTGRGVGGSGVARSTIHDGGGRKAVSLEHAVGHD